MNAHVAPQRINDTRLQDLVSLAGKLGKTDRLDNRHELAVHVCQGAQDGYIDVAKGSKDVADIWKAFQESRAKALGKTRAGNEPSFDVQVSKLNTFARAGVIAKTNQYDAVDVLNRAREIINTSDDIKGSTFDNMVKVARTQVHDDHAQAPLTDAEILDAILPKEAEEKDELATLEALLKSAKKAHDGTKATDSKPAKPGYPSPELASAIASIEQRVAVLQLAKEDAEHTKKKAALEQVLIKRGTSQEARAPSQVPSPDAPPVPANASAADLSEDQALAA